MWIFVGFQGYFAQNGGIVGFLLEKNVDIRLFLGKVVTLQDCKIFATML